MPAVLNMVAPQRSARTAAIALLARREHTVHELEQKLQARGYAAHEVQSTLSSLHGEGLQSDQRFAENYVYERVRRGYGPVRIRFELERRGLEPVWIERALRPHKEDWQRHAAEQRSKRFGTILPTDPRERDRQSSFLHRRGFSAEHIHRELTEGPCPAEQ